MFFVDAKVCISFLTICLIESAFLDRKPNDIIKQCKDTLTNCHLYSDEACDDIFKSWAMKYCPKRCGYCQDFSICEDVYDCSALPGEICSDPTFKKFSLQYCREHCNLCSTVADICSLGLHDCDVHATCIGSTNGYNCTCNRGYIGNGKHCEINDECALGLHDCDSHATCTDTTDGYTCTCKTGYKGKGRYCDPDECTLGLHNCDTNAICKDSAHGFTCNCKTGFTGNGRRCDSIPREDCQDWQEVLKYNQNSASGVYTIKPFSDSKPLKVWCDMKTSKGGWTVFQRRFDGSVDFHRNWTEYKNGFGNASGEYWLGNEILHRMTTKYSTTLRIDLWDKDNLTAYNTYSMFRIDGESSAYVLHVGGVSGNAGGYFIQHNGMKFSASDRDNDRCRLFCSNYYMGGWWYQCCYYSNLNGPYRTPGSLSYGSNTTATFGFRGGSYSLKATQMMIRH